MICVECKETINPSLEIQVDPLSEGPTHCPYCLAIVDDDEAESQPEDQSERGVSVGRFALRRDVRDQFVDKLIAADVAGTAHCPVCEAPLSKNDELLLRSSDHYRCRDCCHDLATVAYRQTAYPGPVWRALADAIDQQRADPVCAGCCYLGAMARSCQKALVWTGQDHGRASHKLRLALTRNDWTEPTCNWKTECPAVGYYRSVAGGQLRLF